ncbi:MAG: DUF6089 family protein [Parafilimonas sp.]
MKHLTCIYFIFFAFVCAEAQKFSIHAGGGIINYGGDLQKKNFTFQQAGAAFSAGASYNFANNFSVNLSLSEGKVQADDAKNGFPKRNLNFKSNIFETALTVEADYKNIWTEASFTPYVFSGIALFHFNPYTYTTAGEKVFLQPLGTEGQGLPEYPGTKLYSPWNFAIPFGLGAKYALSNNIAIGAEISLRYLFTDYLDDVSSLKYADTTLLKNTRGAIATELSYRGDEILGSNYTIRKQRGNPQKKDVYYACLIRFTYMIGESAPFKLYKY